MWYHKVCIMIYLFSSTYHSSCRLQPYKNISIKYSRYWKNIFIYHKLSWSFSPLFFHFILYFFIQLFKPFQIFFLIYCIYTSFQYFFWSKPLLIIWYSLYNILNYFISIFKFIFSFNSHFTKSFHHIIYRIRSIQSKSTTNHIISWRHIMKNYSHFFIFIFFLR